MTTVNKTVRGAMAATGESVGPYRFRRSSSAYETIRVTIYGTSWVGTVTLQTSDPEQGAWVTEAEWTANGAASFTPGGDCDVRLVFTRTSGTAQGSIVSNA